MSALSNTVIQDLNPGNVEFDLPCKVWKFIDKTWNAIGPCIFRCSTQLDATILDLRIPETHKVLFSAPLSS
ncbi:hypothetical protein HK096_010111, partial [Nowakowskiella sp. JEL0078]